LCQSFHVYCGIREWRASTSRRVNLLVVEKSKAGREKCLGPVFFSRKGDILRYGTTTILRTLQINKDRPSIIPSYSKVVEDPWQRSGGKGKKTLTNYD
jgi:hypothetical protein